MACNGQSSTDGVLGCQGARVPGCWLANNTGEQVEGSARGLVGWALGPFLPKSHVQGSKVQGLRSSQGFCPMLIFAFWSESSRNSKKVGGSFFLASPLPSPYGRSCK